MLYTAKITKMDHFFWASDEYIMHVVVNKYADAQFNEEDLTVMR